MPDVRAADQVIQTPARVRRQGMSRVGLLLAVLLVAAACSPAAAITEDQAFWCRTSPDALAFDYFAETFEELHGVSMIEAKAEFGFKEPAGEQVGSRMTVTERGGFPDLESQDAWYSSERFVETCARVYDEKA
jgi:hypothetical protein